MGRFSVRYCKEKKKEEKRRKIKKKTEQIMFTALQLDSTPLKYIYTRKTCNSFIVSNIFYSPLTFFFFFFLLWFYCRRNEKSTFAVNFVMCKSWFHSKNSCVNNCKTFHIQHSQVSCELDQSPATSMKIENRKQLKWPKIVMHLLCIIKSIFCFFCFLSFESFVDRKSFSKLVSVLD